MGASLLVFVNKIDVDGAMSDDEIQEVSFFDVVQEMSLTVRKGLEARCHTHP